MIDYWEAIGRLAYDEDLVNKFETILPPPESINYVTVTSRKNNASSACLDLPTKAYTKVQDLMAPILAEQHLSLFAAGELIWSFNSAKSRELFDQIVDVISQTDPSLDCPSPSYFIALGLVLVDGRFREKVGDCTEALLRLSDSQRDHIRNLVQCRQFRELAQAFDDIPWELGCFVAEAARVEYRHPFALDASKMADVKPLDLTSWAMTPS